VRVELRLCEDVDQDAWEGQLFQLEAFKNSIILLRNSILVRVKIMGQTNTESRNRNFSVLLMTKTQSRRNLKQLTTYHENYFLWTRELAAKQNTLRTSSLPGGEGSLFFFFCLGARMSLDECPSLPCHIFFFLETFHFTVSVFWC
jgi:hypothetical protein